MAKRMTLSDKALQNKKDDILVSRAEQMLTEIEGKETPYNVVLWVKEQIAQGKSTLAIRKELGISDRNDVRWMKIVRDIKGNSFSEEYLARYCLKNDIIIDQLDKRYSELQDRLNHCDNDKDYAALSRELLNVSKELRAATEGIIKTGIDLGVMGDKKKKAGGTQIVVVNNLPRPGSSEPATIDITEVSKD